VTGALIVIDLIFLLATIGFFAMGILYTYACGRL
jgi:hypothetical protein